MFLNIIGVIAGFVYGLGGWFTFKTWYRYYLDTHPEPSRVNYVLTVIAFILFWIVLYVIIFCINAGIILERELKKFAERI